MAYKDRLLEEELKNKVAKDWFGCYDCTKIIGNKKVYYLPFLVESHSEYFHG